MAGKEIKFIRVPDEETMHTLMDLNISIPENVEYVILVEPEPPLDRIAEIEDVLYALVKQVRDSTWSLPFNNPKINAFVEKVEKRNSSKDNNQ